MAWCTLTHCFKSKCIEVHIKRGTVRLKRKPVVARFAIKNPKRNTIVAIKDLLHVSKKVAIEMKVSTNQLAWKLVFVTSISFLYIDIELIVAWLYYAILFIKKKKKLYYPFLIRMFSFMAVLCSTHAHLSQFTFKISKSSTLSHPLILDEIDVSVFDK